MGSPSTGSKSGKFVAVRVQGAHKDESHEILAVNAFSSKRKCMSIVIRGPDGRIRVIAKGADDVILANATPGYDSTSILNNLRLFATKGLRTLVVGEREISVKEYNVWKARHRCRLRNLGK